jgi:hypothetical protein
MPEKIRFQGDENLLKYTDFLYTKPDWPILSKRMLNVLISVKDFQYQAIPIVIEDNLVTEVLGNDPKNWIISGRKNNDYVIVQLLEHMDLFDYENSIYELNSLFPGSISNIQKMVLKEPEDGFPPVFRLSNKPTHLYVSAEAKIALETAGIQGIKFSTYQLSSFPHDS